MRLVLLSSVLLANACSASDPSLIQHDPDAAGRQRETKNVSMSIRNEMRTHSPSAHGQTFRLNPGPIPYPGSLAESIVIEENLIFVSNANPDVPLIFGIAERFNISTVDDYDAMYAALEAVIPTPLSRDSSDEGFAQDRLTLKGGRLRAVKENESFDSRLHESPIYDSCGEKSIDKLLKKNRLFVEDLTFVSEYNDLAAPSKYAPSSVGYFCVAKKSGKFVPLAIQLIDTDIMYFPDDADDWTLAKMALNAASLQVQQIDHFIETHLMLEPIRVELLRNVSPRHPVYKLLEHHFTQLFANSVAGLTGLLSEGVTYDKMFAWGASGTLRYLEEKLPQASFADGFVQRIEKDGLKHVPDYRYRDYGTMHWNALEKFLGLYLEPYYGTSTGKSSLRGRGHGRGYGRGHGRGRSLDNKHKKKSGTDCEDLELDTELQSWARASCSIVDDFPCHFDDVDDVVNTLTNIIFRITVQHHVMNSDGAWNSVSYPFNLPSLSHPLPTTKGTAIDFLDYVLPRSVLGETLAQVAFFHRRIGPEVAILTSYAAVDLGSPSFEAVLEFERELAQIEMAIDERESHQDHPFVLMKPSRLPYYCWA